MSQARDFSTEPRGRAPGSVDLLVLGVALVAALVAASAAWRAWSELGRAQAATLRAHRDLADYRTRVLQPERGRPDDTLASQVLLSRTAPPQRVVAELAALLPAEVRLEGLHLEYRNRVELDLRVRARGPDAYDRFLQNLKRSPQFTEILPGEETRDGELSASVRLVRREGLP